VVAGRVDAVAAEGLILNLGGITVVYIVNDIQHTHSILYLFRQSDNNIIKIFYLIYLYTYASKTLRKI